MFTQRENEIGGGPEDRIGGFEKGAFRITTGRRILKEQNEWQEDG